MSEIVYNLCDSAVFCALHDQSASLGRHAPLTRCFSAVAELLVTFDMQMTRIVLPQMLERKKGAIISISSLSGALPSPLLTVYSGCKVFIRITFSADFVLSSVCYLTNMIICYLTNMIILWIRN